MILVTLGTQDKKFYRLLEAIEKQISIGNIKEEVIVQAGYSSDYKSKKMKIFDLIPMDEFDKLISECNILITHGGVGTITTGLRKDKKVIAAARLKKHCEHTNDHQLQIIENFKEAGYILALEDFDNLDKILKQAKKFKPNKYESNTKKFIRLIEKEINEYIGGLS